MAPSTGLPCAAWRTSSYSNNGGNCIEVMASDGAVGVRDTKRRSGLVLTFSPRAWQRFAGSLKG
jgi:hypothetical protein